MHGRTTLAAAAIASLALLLPATAPAATTWVDPRRGDDAAPGTRARPVRTITEAWDRIPRDRRLTTPHRIELRAGVYRPGDAPHYWERRRGDRRRAPIVLHSADGRGRAVLPSMNVFAVHGLTLDGVALRSGGGDVLHCERCRDLTVVRSDIRGSTASTQETIKVNQSRGVRILRSRVGGAWQNAIDLVAVRTARIAGNVVEDAGDWCAYAKGGSADVVVRDNLIRRCGTGGFTAGEGSGLQYLVPPFLHHEATGVLVERNTVRDTEGAAFGVNGGFAVLIRRNVALRTGARSHLLEVVFGGRTCDGGPDDPTRATCAAHLRRGGWGTTAPAGEGVLIPSRHVQVLDNVWHNPAPYRTAYQHLTVFGAVPDQPGSNVPRGARADDDLRFAGNVIHDGPRDHPLGVGDPDGGCPPGHPTCDPRRLARDNVVNRRVPVLRPARGGRLVPAGWTARRRRTPAAAPRWADRPAGVPVLWRRWPRR